MERQTLQGIGHKVEEFTVYLGRSRDDGLRSGYMAVVIGRSTRQWKFVVPDWVATDVVALAAHRLIENIEDGKTDPLFAKEWWSGYLHEAEEAPF